MAEKIYALRGAACVGADLTGMRFRQTHLNDAVFRTSDVFSSLGEFVDRPGDIGIDAGGGVVEAYPQDTPGKKASATFLYSATRSMFERAGFAYLRPTGKITASQRGDRPPAGVADHGRADPVEPQPRR